MSKKTKAKNPAKAMTPKFRVSFPELYEAKAMEEGQKAKYGITMLFPKGTNLKALEKAHDAALEKGIQDKWNGKKPKNLRSPFRDGDEEDGYCDRDGFPGHIFVRASSLQKPGVIDADKDRIDDPAEVYAGCYARATVVAYAYDVAGNKGVAFGLQNVQKLKDGESFSGRMKAEDEFDEYEDEDDEEDDFDE